jgi:putative membrane protein
MGSRKFLFTIVFGILLILLSLDPPFPEQMFLQHSATLIAIAIMIWDIRKNYFSTSAFFFFWLFMVLHIIGARWIYSNVPYNEWFISILNFNLNEYFGFERNHYDRFVHFAFGITFFPVVYEIITKNLKCSFKTALLLTFFAIQFFSLFYELFEWLLTILLSPEEAENYNGQQGDIWDAHKDMALAMLGSGLIFLKYQIFNRKSVR